MAGSRCSPDQRGLSLFSQGGTPGTRPTTGPRGRSSSRAVVVGVDQPDPTSPAGATHGRGVVRRCIQGRPGPSSSCYETDTKIWNFCPVRNDAIRLGGKRLRRQALDPPAAGGRAVAQPVVQAIGALLPELD